MGNIYPRYTSGDNNWGCLSIIGACTVAFIGLVVFLTIRGCS